MTQDNGDAPVSLSADGSASPLAAVRRATPARLLVGSAGHSYRTETQLELRRDHAAAVDAVWGELDLQRDLGEEVIEWHNLFEVTTQASGKQEYLLRPDLGRRLSEEAQTEIVKRCATKPELQVAIGDGLSVAAIAAQAPLLLPLLQQGAMARGWTFGNVFVIRHCRVGVLNDIGNALTPEVVVLLIGERPGLSTAESLSAYMAYRPQPGHTDAQRNLVSNIHARGVSPVAAAQRIFDLA